MADSLIIMYSDHSILNWTENKTIIYHLVCSNYDVDIILSFFPFITPTTLLVVNAFTTNTSWTQPVRFESLMLVFCMETVNCLLIAAYWTDASCILAWDIINCADMYIQTRIFRYLFEQVWVVNEPLSAYKTWLNDHPSCIYHILRACDCTFTVGTHCSAYMTFSPGILRLFLYQKNMCDIN